MERTTLEGMNNLYGVRKVDRRLAMATNGVLMVGKIKNKNQILRELEAQVRAEEAVAIKAATEQYIHAIEEDTVEELDTSMFAIINENSRRLREERLAWEREQRKKNARKNNKVNSIIRALFR